MVAIFLRRILPAVLFIWIGVVFPNTSKPNPRNKALGQVVEFPNTSIPNPRNEAIIQNTTPEKTRRPCKPTLYIGQKNRHCQLSDEELQIGLILYTIFPIGTFLLFFVLCDRRDRLEPVAIVDDNNNINIVDLNNNIMLTVDRNN